MSSMPYPFSFDAFWGTSTADAGNKASAGNADGSPRGDDSVRTKVVANGATKTGGGRNIGCNGGCANDDGCCPSDSDADIMTKNDADDMIKERTAVDVAGSDKPPAKSHGKAERKRRSKKGQGLLMSENKGQKKRSPSKRQSSGTFDDDLRLDAMFHRYAINDDGKGKDNDNDNNYGNEINITGEENSSNSSSRAGDDTARDSSGVESVDSATYFLDKVVDIMKAMSTDRADPVGVKFSHEYDTDGYSHTTGSSLGSISQRGSAVHSVLTKNSSEEQTVHSAITAAKDEDDCDEAASDEDIMIGANSGRHDEPTLPMSNRDADWQERKQQDIMRKLRRASENTSKPKSKSKSKARSKQSSAPSASSNVKAQIDALLESQDEDLDNHVPQGFLRPTLEVNESDDDDDDDDSSDDEPTRQANIMMEPDAILESSSSTTALKVCVSTRADEVETTTMSTVTLPSRSHKMDAPEFKPAESMDRYEAIDRGASDTSSSSSSASQSRSDSEQSESDAAQQDLQLDASSSSSSSHSNPYTDADADHGGHDPPINSKHLDRDNTGTITARASHNDNNNGANQMIDNVPAPTARDYDSEDSIASSTTTAAVVIASSASAASAKPPTSTAEEEQSMSSHKAIADPDMMSLAKDRALTAPVDAQPQQTEAPTAEIQGATAKANDEPAQPTQQEPAIVAIPTQFAEHGIVMETSSNRKLDSKKTKRNNRPKKPSHDDSQLVQKSQQLQRHDVTNASHKRPNAADNTEQEEDIDIAQNHALTTSRQQLISGMPLPKKSSSGPCGNAPNSDYQKHLSSSSSTATTAMETLNSNEHGDDTDEKHSKELELSELVERHMWKALAIRIQRQPNSANQIMKGDASVHSMNGGGNLLLHEICKHEPTRDIVEAVLRTNRRAVAIKGERDYLPLHYACASAGSVEVVETLLQAHPEAVNSRDCDDLMMPLHLACKWGASKHVLALLLTSHPEATLARDIYGKIPMDYAMDIVSPDVKRETIDCLRWGLRLIEFPQKTPIAEPTHADMDAGAPHVDETDVGADGDADGDTNAGTVKTDDNSASATRRSQRSVRFAPSPTRPIREHRQEQTSAARPTISRDTRVYEEDDQVSSIDGCFNHRGQVFNGDANNDAGHDSLETYSDYSDDGDDNNTSNSNDEDTPCSGVQSHFRQELLDEMSSDLALDDYASASQDMAFGQRLQKLEQVDSEESDESDGFTGSRLMLEEQRRSILDLEHSMFKAMQQAQVDQHQAMEERIVALEENQEMQQDIIQSLEQDLEDAEKELADALMDQELHFTELLKNEETKADDMKIRLHETEEMHVMYTKALLETHEEETEKFRALAMRFRDLEAKLRGQVQEEVRRREDIEEQLRIREHEFLHLEMRLRHELWEEICKREQDASRTVDEERKVAALDEKSGNLEKLLVKERELVKKLQLTENEHRRQLDKQHATIETLEQSKVEMLSRLAKMENMIKVLEHARSHTMSLLETEKKRVEEIEVADQRKRSNLEFEKKKVKAVQKTQARRQAVLDSLQKKVNKLEMDQQITGSCIVELEHRLQLADDVRTQALRIIAHSYDESANSTNGGDAANTQNQERLRVMELLSESFQPEFDPEASGRLSRSAHGSASTRSGRSNATDMISEDMSVFSEAEMKRLASMERMVRENKWALEAEQSKVNDLDDERNRLMKLLAEKDEKLNDVAKKQNETSTRLEQQSAEIEKLMASMTRQEVARKEQAEAEARVLEELRMEKIENEQRLLEAQDRVVDLETTLHKQEQDMTTAANDDAADISNARLRESNSNTSKNVGFTPGRTQGSTINETNENHSGDVDDVEDNDDDVGDDQHLFEATSDMKFLEAELEKTRLELTKRIAFLGRTEGSQFDLQLEHTDDESEAGEDSAAVDIPETAAEPPANEDESEAAVQIGGDSGSQTEAQLETVIETETETEPQTTEVQHENIVPSMTPSELEEVKEEEDDHDYDDEQEAKDPEQLEVVDVTTKLDDENIDEEVMESAEPTQVEQVVERQLNTHRHNQNLSHHHHIVDADQEIASLHQDVQRLRTMQAMHLLQETNEVKLLRQQQQQQKQQQQRTERADRYSSMATIGAERAQQQQQQTREDVHATKLHSDVADERDDVIERTEERETMEPRPSTTEAGTTASNTIVVEDIEGDDDGDAPLMVVASKEPANAFASYSSIENQEDAEEDVHPQPHRQPKQQQYQQQRDANMDTSANVIAIRDDHLLPDDAQQRLLNETADWILGDRAPLNEE